MIHKMPSPRPGHVRVVFELPACIWADRIFLVGEFNDWALQSIPFVQGRDGVWRAAVDLIAGCSYQFRYLVDGSWQTDYHADGWLDNEYGTQNSIVNATLPNEMMYDQTSMLYEDSRSSTRQPAQVGVSPMMQRGKSSGYWKPAVTKAAG